MKRTVLSLTMICTLFAVNTVALAKDTVPAEDPRHNELRAVLTDVQDAINKMDFDKIKSHLDPSANVMYQNGEIADGIDAVVAFYNRMLVGDSALLKSYSAKISADALSEFYGDTAVAYGTIDETMILKKGGMLNITSRWTATLAKESGNWKIVSLQLGTNVFDNPLLSAVKKSVVYVGSGTLIFGLLIGYFVAKSRFKKSSSR